MALGTANEIIDDLVTAILTVQESAGFSVTVSAARQLSRAELDNTRPLVVILWIGTTEDERITVESFLFETTVRLVCLLDRREEGIQETNRRESEFAHEVLRAVFAQDYALKPYSAPRFTAQPVEELDLEEPEIGVVLDLVFSYEVSETTLDFTGI